MMPRFLLSKCFIIGFYDDFSLFSLPCTASQAMLCDEEFYINAHLYAKYYHES